MATSRFRERRLRRILARRPGPGCEISQIVVRRLMLVVCRPVRVQSTTCCPPIRRSGTVSCSGRDCWTGRSTPSPRPDTARVGAQGSGTVMGLDEVIEWMATKLSRCSASARPPRANWSGTTSTWQAPRTTGLRRRRKACSTKTLSPRPGQTLSGVRTFVRGRKVGLHQTGRTIAAPRSGLRCSLLGRRLG